MATKFFKIFRAGTHRAMGGKTISFSRQDVADMATYYPLAKKQAPLVLGHPRSDDGPSLGKVLSLHEKGGALFAEADAADELIGLVRAKQCAGVSCSFFTKDDPLNPVPGFWGLRHVGFMVGGMKPALKDLGELAFSDMAYQSDVVAFQNEIDPPINTLPWYCKHHTFATQADELQRLNPGMTYEKALSIVTVPPGEKSAAYE